MVIILLTSKVTWIN